MKFDFSSKKGVLVVKFTFATAILKIETLRMPRRFARVFKRGVLGTLFPRALSFRGNEIRVTVVRRRLEIYLKDSLLLPLLSKGTYFQNLTFVPGDSYKV